MSNISILKHSVAEYLASEKKSLEKHEFYQGEIFAMTGASIPQNQIVRNMLFEVDGHLRKGDKCKIFPSNVKIYITENSFFTY